MTFTRAFLFYIQLFAVVVESFVVVPSWNSASRRQISTTTNLSAYTPPNGGSSQYSSWGGSRSNGSSVPSKTACESAVNIEWEPMSELERRIEDGIHYEHIPNYYRNEQHMPGCHPKAKRIIDAEEEDDTPGVRAVFCAYRYSEEDYNRLKSADV
ncbi:unnamed protein product [Pseudo-nitzschia multistriata]|uniref:Uncharacterized protein n=1 Tax=Pseudo-nitzschia multistriata TaxID=183589 RepID=A0A448YVE2_9STRA|nr:unnamed protein product [Pseudo-nitzschia multistriata]